MLRVQQHRCHHNFRSSRASGQPSLCILCICENLDEIFENESLTSGTTITIGSNNPTRKGNGTSSQNISNRNRTQQNSSLLAELVHNLRLLNTSLDNADQMDITLLEKTTRPIIDTFTGLLRVPNDEVGLLITQGVEKLSTKISPSHREYFQKKIISQIREQETPTLGPLECLRVLLMSDESVAGFVQKSGQDILPVLLKVLRSISLSASTEIFSSRDGNNGRLNSQPQPGAEKSELNNNNTRSSSQTIMGLNHNSTVSSKMGFGNCSSNSNSNSKGDGTLLLCGEQRNEIAFAAYSIIEKILSIPQAQLGVELQAAGIPVAGESPENPQDKVVVENKDEVECFNKIGGDGRDLLLREMPQITEILKIAVRQLKESPPVNVLLKILELLTKLTRYESVLSTLLGNQLGLSLCSGLKKMLYHNSNALQKQAIRTLLSMFSTYQMAMYVPSDDYHSLLAELPALIEQVDLIYTLSQTLATTDKEIFNLVIQLLNIFSIIPYLNGKLVIALESVVRIISVFINAHNGNSDYQTIPGFAASVMESLDPVPQSIQQQIISLYCRLPGDWKSIQYIPWAKLLIHCTDPNFHSMRLELYRKGCDIFRKSPFSIASLKLFLILSHTSLISLSDNLNVNSQEQDCSQAHEQNYEGMAKIILGDLIGIRCLPAIMVLTKYGKAHESPYISILLEILFYFPPERLEPPGKFCRKKDEVFTVEYNNELDSDVNVVHTEDISVPAEGLYDENGYWSASSYLKLLFWVRSNMEFLKDRGLYDKWNINFSIIVAAKYRVYLPQLANIWSHLLMCSSTQSADECLMFRNVFETLDLEISKWERVIKISKSKGISPSTKLKVEAVLIFYYFYSLFVMDEAQEILSFALVNNIANFLELLLNYRQEEEANSSTFHWQRLSFYFKTALLIISCALDHRPQKLIEVYETLILDVPEATSDFEYIVTYNAKVFDFLLHWNLVPCETLTDMLEKWLLLDPSSFKKFLRAVNLQESSLRNHVVALIAYGSSETSNYMIAVVKEKRHKDKDRLIFEAITLQTTLDKVKNTIIQSESVGVQSKILINFSNLMELMLVADGPLFCEENNVPSEFFHDLITIMVRHSYVHDIGLKCMDFFFKFLSRVDSPRFVQSICHENDKLVQFLGNRLSLRKGCLRENAMAFKLMSVLVDNCSYAPEDDDNQLDGISDKNMSIKKVANWSLGLVLPDIQFMLTDASVWELIIVLLKKNLNSELINVKERTFVGQELCNLLVNLQFHALSLLNKLINQPCVQILWDFLDEVLYFAQRSFVNQPVYLKNIILNPWSRMLICVSVVSEKSPKSLNISCLKFLQQWTRKISDLNTGNPYLFHCGYANYQSFSSLSAFYQLLDFLKPIGPAESTRENIPPRSQSTDSDADESRTELINEIVDSCVIFLYGKSTPTISNSNDLELNSSINADGDSQCQPLSKSQVSNSSGSSTCSSEEFDFDPTA